MNPKIQSYPRKDGSTGYRTKITVNGKGVNSPTFDSRDDVLTWVAKVRVSRAAFGESFDVDRPRTPLRNYIEIWMSERPVVGYRATRTKERSAIKKINERFGDRPIASITRHDIQQWVNDLAGANPDYDGRSYKRSTIETYYGVLSGILRTAAADHYLPAGSPLGKHLVKLPRKRASDKGFMVLDYDALEHLLDTVEERFPEWYAFILTVAETGCRISEAAGLHREHYDPEAQTLTFESSLVKEGSYVEGDSTKNDEEKVVYVTDRLAEVLEEHLAEHDHDLIFPQTNGRPLQLDNWRKRVWRKIKAEAGLPSKFRMHDLRHTLGSQLIDSGVPDTTVADILGHKNTRMVRERYAHALDDRQKEAFQLKADRSAARRKRKSA